MAVIKKDGNIMALPLSISRGNPIALDATQVWYEESAMTAYAETDPTAYPGQFLTLVDEANSTVTAYVIANTAGTLVKLASTTASGDVSADIIALQGRCTSLETRMTSVEDSIAGITGFDFQVVDKLPETGEKGIIYLVAHDHGTTDAYDEYIWTGSGYEKIGNTDVDLANYYTKSETDSAIAEAVKPINEALAQKQPLNSNLTTLSALTGAGLVRKSEIGFELDSTAYITENALAPYATTEALTNAQTALEGKITAAEANALAQAKAYTDENKYDDTAIKADIAANASSIGTINTKIGTIETAVSANEQAIADINDADSGILATAKTYTDNKVAANKTLIDSLTERVTTAENTLAEKASTTALEAEITRAKAAEKTNADAIALILDNPDTSAIDSIKELTAYVEEHGAETTSILNRLAGIGGEDEPATVLAAIEASAIKSTSSFGIENNEVSFVSTDLLSQGEAEFILNGGSAE